MYKLLSPQIIINNVLTLSLPFIKNKNQIDPVALKQAYRDYLSQLQPYCPYINEAALFHSTPEVETAFAKYFISEESELKLAEEKKIPLDKVLYPKATERQAALEKSFTKMATVDPTFADVFKLVMNTVFCDTSQRRGGTSINPRYVGVMCAHHDMNFEEDAIPEAFIHEFTHNALFLDELCHGHCHYSVMRSPDAMADIRFIGYEYKLSFYRCLHSLIVSAEILMARDKFIGHQPRTTQHLPSAMLVERAKIYIKAMKNNPLFPKIGTPRGQELFARCEKFYAGYEPAI